MSNQFLEFIIIAFIIEIPISIVSIIFIFYIENINLTIKKVMTYVLLFSIIIVIPSSIVVQIGDNGYITLISTIATSIYSILIKNIIFATTFKKKSLHLFNAILLDSYIVNTIGYLSTISLYILFDTSKIYFGYIYLISYYIFFPISFIIFFYIIKKINFNNLFDQLFKTRKIKIAFTSALIVLSILITFITELSEKIHNGTSIIPSTLFIVAFALFFYISSHNLSQENLIAQKKLMNERKNYIDTLSKLQDEIKLFQSDYMNTISNLHLSAQKDTVSHVDDQLNELDDYLLYKLNIASNLSAIQISEIKNLITTKLNIMEEKNIILDLKVSGIIYKDSIDITYLVNNTEELLNSAIDYACANDTIELLLENNGKSLITTITSNSYTVSYEYS